MRSIVYILLSSMLIAMSFTQTTEDRRVFYNGSGLVFFKAQEPLIITIDNVNFTLNADPAVSGTTDNSTNILSLDFTNVKGNGSDILTSANIRMSFNQNAGYWKMTSAVVSAAGTVNNKPVQSSDVEMLGMKIEAPVRYSYHCSRILRYRSSANDSLVMSVKGVQLQPFDIKNDRFDDGYDCEGFFSVAIWAGIFIAILMGLLLGWGINMIMSINTPDRFDDPKGKALVINAQE